MSKGFSNAVQYYRSNWKYSKSIQNFYRSNNSSRCLSWQSEGFKLVGRRKRAHCPKEAGESCKGSGRAFRYVRTGREKEAEGPSARSGCEP